MTSYLCREFIFVLSFAATVLTCCFCGGMCPSFSRQKTVKVSVTVATEDSVMVSVTVATEECEGFRDCGDRRFCEGFRDCGDRS